MTIAKDMMVNDGIRAREVRLIGQDGEQLGVKSKVEALKIAEQANLDVVLSSSWCETTCSAYYGLREIPLRTTEKRT